MIQKSWQFCHFGANIQNDVMVSWSHKKLCNIVRHLVGWQFACIIQAGATFWIMYRKYVPRPRLGRLFRFSTKHLRKCCKTHNLAFHNSQFSMLHFKLYTKEDSFTMCNRPFVISPALVNTTHCRLVSDLAFSVSNTKKKGEENTFGLVPNNQQFCGLHFSWENITKGSQQCFSAPKNSEGQSDQTVQNSELVMDPDLSECWWFASDVSDVV